MKQTGADGLFPLNLSDARLAFSTNCWTSNALVDGPKTDLEGSDVLSNAIRCNGELGHSADLLRTGRRANPALQGMSDAVPRKVSGILKAELYLLAGIGIWSHVEDFKTAVSCIVWTARQQLLRRPLAVRAGSRSHPSVAALTLPASCEAAHVVHLAIALPSARPLHQTESEDSGNIPVGIASGLLHKRADGLSVFIQWRALRSPMSTRAWRRGGGRRGFTRPTRYRCKCAA